MASKWIGLLAPLSFFGCVSTSNAECLVRRAAFDIGSETTKMRVADVDTCAGKVAQTLLSEEVKVSYVEALSPTGELPPEILAKGSEALAQLKARAVANGATEFAGVGTSALRKARNGEAFLASVETSLQIKARVISAQEEAILGFLGATQEVSLDPRNLVVWDIGGGSMQMTAKTENGYEVYAGTLASVGFRNHVIEQVQHKPLASTPSPNPISDAQAGEAWAYAKSFAAKDVPAVLKERIAAPETRVVGVGGVLYHSVRGQLKDKNPFSAADVTAALPARLNQTDAQLGGEYASTDVSNLLMVGGFMEGLSIREVQAVKVNLTNGALVYDRLW